MKPHLHIHLFGKRISSFHFFGVLGYILGAVLGVLVSLSLNLDPGIVLLMAATGAATFFGLAFLAKWIAGKETIVYYHHEITIMVLCTLALLALNKPVLPYLDITLLGIGTFLAFGRIGCYSVGCCHGRPYKHGVVYGQQHVDAGFTWFYKNIRLLPVQLIESVYVAATVAAGIILLLNHAIPGTVLIVYTVVYGLMRFILEFFRGDAERPLWQGLSEAQWTTLALTAITYLMSINGWLPQYAWHWIILAVMIIASIVTIYYFHRNPEHALFFPPHIRQLAEGLNVLENVNAAPAHTQAVNIYTTRSGLSVSCGRHPEGGGIDFFTLSTKNKTAISQRSAKRMAQIIGMLTHHPGNYELIEKQNGIYHILFRKRQANGNEA